MALIKKMYYSISEVSEYVSETINTLRYWEKEFTKLNPLKTAGGTRKYTEGDIQFILIIQNLLRRQGLTLDGAKLKISNDYSDLRIRNEVQMRLKKVRDELLGIRRELNSVKPTSKDEII